MIYINRNTFNVCLYLNGFIFKPFIDVQKAKLILYAFKKRLSSTDYYGIGFIAFAVAFTVNLPQIIRKKDPAFPLAIATLLSLLFYMIILYQIAYKWDSIENVLAYSAKRFLFCFIPLIWLYALSNSYATSLLCKLEKALNLKL